MATANHFIIRALTRLGIRASETSLQADEIQDGLYVLNDMLSAMEPGLRLGFSPVEGITDEVRIPREANGAMIDQLAIKLAPEFGRSVSIDLLRSAKDSWRNMLISMIFIGDVDYPSTLPKGSGNNCDYDNFINDTFFPEKDTKNF